MRRYNPATGLCEEGLHIRVEFSVEKVFGSVELRCAGLLRDDDGGYVAGSRVAPGAGGARLLIVTYLRFFHSLFWCCNSSNPARLQITS